jgi:hypothetical protein
MLGPAATVAPAVGGWRLGPDWSAAIARVPDDLLILAEQSKEENQ